MWTRTFTKVYPGLRKEAVWALWTDVNNWPLWHGDLESCVMNGDFEVGNHFYLKPKGMKAVKIVLTDLKEGMEFTDCTRFWGAKMYDTHRLEEVEGGLRLTNILRVEGPLKRLWIKLVAQHVADTVEEETEALVRLARRAA